MDVEKAGEEETEKGEEAGKFVGLDLLINLMGQKN